MRRALLTLTVVPIVAGLPACGSSSSSSHGAQPPARLEHLGPSKLPSIVLSPLGMKRIGIQTAPVAGLGTAAAPITVIRHVRINGHLRRVVVHRPAPAQTGPTATIPYSALVYESDGTPVVYTQAAQGVYSRARLSVAYISGNNVFVNAGPRPGTRVVTVGAAELLGVENGVGAS